MRDAIELLNENSITLEEYQVFQIFGVYTEGRQYLEKKLMSVVLEPQLIPNKTTDMLQWFDGRISCFREIFMTVDKVKSLLKQPAKPVMQKPHNPFKRDEITGASLTPSPIGPINL